MPRSTIYNVGEIRRRFDVDSMDFGAGSWPDSQNLISWEECDENIRVKNRLTTKGNEVWKHHAILSVIISDDSDL